MSARGFCPTVWEPMPTGDGLLARVKPPGCALSAEAAILLAETAARHGNGTIEVTGRASLQVRGLRPESSRPFADAMVAAGLADPDPAIERRRNVICDRAGAALALRLERGLAAEEGLAELPAKFGFAVDGTGTAPGDIRIRVSARACEVSLDGGDLAVAVDGANAPDLALTLARAFLDWAGPHRRMRDLAGADALLARAGRPAPRTPPAAPDPIGPRALRELAVALPFGTLSSANLRVLAETSLADSDGILRVTPSRALVLSGLTRPLQLDSADFITDPADPRLRVFACTGWPGCGSATVATRPLAWAIAHRRPTGTVHVSGCSKGCAHPGRAELTWVGREGRFDLVRDGCAGDHPVRSGLTPAEVLG